MYTCWVLFGSVEKDIYTDRYTDTYTDTQTSLLTPLKEVSDVKGVRKENGFASSFLRKDQQKENGFAPFSSEANLTP